MTYLAGRDGYRAVPFAVLIRHPGMFGVTITPVAGPCLRMLPRAESSGRPEHAGVRPDDQETAP